MSKYVLDIGAMGLGIEDVAGLYKEPTKLIPTKKGIGVYAPNTDKIKIDPMNNKLGAKYSVACVEFAEQSVDVDIPLPSNKTLLDEAFGACWMERIDDKGITTYKFNTNSNTTASIKQTAQRVITKITGAVGDFSISAKAGEAANIKFNFKGKLEEQRRLANVEDNNEVPDSPDFEPLFMKNDCASYLINGNGAVVDSFELNLNAKVVVPKNSCSVAYIEDIEPTLKIVVSDTIENEMAFEDIKKAKEFNFVLPLFDINGNKKVEIVIPKGVPTEDKNPATEGRITIERTLECRRVVGDDSFEIRYFD
jgi:hypothetical protein